MKYDKMDQMTVEEIESLMCRPRYCDICRTPLNGPAPAEQHYSSRHHKKKAETLLAIKKMDAANPSPSRNLYCVTCRVMFDSQSELNDHNMTPEHRQMREKEENPIPQPVSNLFLDAIKVGGQDSSSECTGIAANESSSKISRGQGDRYAEGNEIIDSVGLGPIGRRSPGGDASCISEQLISNTKGCDDNVIKLDSRMNNFSASLGLLKPAQEIGKKQETANGIKKENNLITEEMLDREYELSPLGHGKCFVCNVALTSLKLANEHLKGKKHINARNARLVRKHCSSRANSDLEFKNSKQADAGLDEQRTSPKISGLSKISHVPLSPGSAKVIVKNDTTVRNSHRIKLDDNPITKALGIVSTENPNKPADSFSLSLHSCSSNVVNDDQNIRSSVDADNSSLTSINNGKRDLLHSIYNRKLNDHANSNNSVMQAQKNDPFNSGMELKHAEKDTKNKENFKSAEKSDLNYDYDLHCADKSIQFPSNVASRDSVEDKFYDVWNTSPSKTNSTDDALAANLWAWGPFPNPFPRSWGPFPRCGIVPETPSLDIRLKAGSDELSDNRKYGYTDKNASDFDKKENGFSPEIKRPEIGSGRDCGMGSDSELFVSYSNCNYEPMIDGMRWISPVQEESNSATFNNIVDNISRMTLNDINSDKNLCDATRLELTFPSDRGVMDNSFTAQKEESSPTHLADGPVIQTAASKGVVTDRIVANGNIVREISINTDRTIWHQCPVCNKKLNSAKQLAIHMSSHGDLSLPQYTGLINPSSQNIPVRIEAGSPGMVAIGATGGSNSTVFVNDAFKNSATSDLSFDGDDNYFEEDFKTSSGDANSKPRSSNAADMKNSGNVNNDSNFGLGSIGSWDTMKLYDGIMNGKVSVNDIIKPDDKLQSTLRQLLFLSKKN